MMRNYFYFTSTPSKMAGSFLYEQDKDIEIDRHRPSELMMTLDIITRRIEPIKSML